MEEPNDKRDIVLGIITLAFVAYLGYLVGVAV